MQDPNQNPEIQVEASEKQRHQVPVPITEETAQRLRSLGVQSRLYECRTLVPSRPLYKHNQTPSMVYRRASAELERHYLANPHLSRPTFALVPFSLDSDIEVKWDNQQELNKEKNVEDLRAFAKANRNDSGYWASPKKLPSKQSNDSSGGCIVP